MKLITLNIWGSRIENDLLDFLAKHEKDTDIFCFQEVYNGPIALENEKDKVTDIFSKIAKVLPNFKGFHGEAGKFDVGSGVVPYGIAMFVRKGVEIQSCGVDDIFELNEQVGLPEGFALWNRLLQHVTIPYRNTTLTIFNLHGLYTGGGKEDNQARLLQSERIRKIMDRFSGEKILCGDFNLNPDTKSLQLLKDGLRDLIHEYHVTSTRSSYYPQGRPKYADYMLVSHGIEVKNFAVLPDEISDHLALELTF